MAAFGALHQSSAIARFGFGDTTCKSCARRKGRQVETINIIRRRRQKQCIYGREMCPCQLACRMRISIFLYSLSSLNNLPEQVSARIYVDSLTCPLRLPLRTILPRCPARGARARSVVGNQPGKVPSWQQNTATRSQSKPLLNSEWVSGSDSLAL